tara:strand:- start:5303 stop:6286 length:984 start_codon:yes stop_codon:yes gene_type:complete
MFIVHSINKSLEKLLESDEKVILFGEDLVDPYGGAFKVTKGLSTKFPDRVLNMPISELSITGFGIGLSMSGYKPIIEIMFGDFITLATDQIINHLSKFYYMLDNQKPKSFILRTPMGGGRGYGPTHSQSLEKIFFGIPGINILAINPFLDAGCLYEKAVGNETPSIIIENKLLYSEENQILNNSKKISFTKQFFPTAIIINDANNHPDITIVSYGRMAKICYEISEKLHEEGLNCELIVPSIISPIDFEPINNSLYKSKILITVEEGYANFGFGSEIISKMQNNFSFKSLRIGLGDHIIYNSRILEDKVLPNKKTIYDKIISFLVED